MINYNTDTLVNESCFDDLCGLQEITDAEQIIELLGDMIIIDRYINNFSYLYNRIVDVAALCWNNKDEHGDKLQHTIIKFKVNIDDKETYGLPLNRFMISLVFIKAISKYIHEVDIKDFILDDFISDTKREKIQDNIVNVLMSNGNSIKEVQCLMAEMSLDLKELLLVFAQADMQIFTAENLFLNYYRDSEVIREINNTEYGNDVQTSEIVQENKRRYDILAKEMIERGNPLFLDNKFTKIIKPKQMEELYINFSQIPDGKNIVPVIMNGNGFRAGYHDIDVLYAGAIAARVPDIMNEDHMGSAGYFNRNLMILTYGTLSKTVYDCGSVNTLPITIDEDVLDMFDGRYYYDTPDSQVLRLLKSEDKHLIGKKLYFRSPCKCNLNEDVCHVCYGTKALKVSNLKGGFIYTTELLTNRVSKNILSAKHLLKADAEKIEFSKDFEKYFIIDSSTIVPDDSARFDIYFKDDYLDNIENELTIYIGKELKPITISHYANIYVPEKIIDNSKDVLFDEVLYHKITSYKVLEMGGALCNITPINIMMTRKYMDIMKLFSSDISKSFETVEDVVITLMRMTQGIIPFYSVHGEIIVSKLLRDINNRLLRPNFLVPDVQYQMLNLKTALQNIEAPTTALAFEQTRHHLLHSIFDERNKINRVGPRSFADYLFGEECL